jgi:hypothetical protein
LQFLTPLPHRRQHGLDLVKPVNSHDLTILQLKQIQLTNQNRGCLERMNFPEKSSFRKNFEIKTAQEFSNLEMGLQFQ